MPSIEEIEVKLEVMNSGEIMNRFAKTIIKKVMEKQLKESDCCTIRQASVEDAPMIAEAIIMAVGEDTVKRFCRGDCRNTATAMRWWPRLTGWQQEQLSDMTGLGCMNCGNRFSRSCANTTASVPLLPKKPARGSFTWIQWACCHSFADGA